MAEAHPDLFSEFTIPQYADWVAVAREELQGKDPEQALAWQVADLQGYPYYTNEQSPANPIPVSALAPWQNIPLLTVNDETICNKTALEHLNGGADGVLFYIQNNADVSVEKLLNKIEWPHCSISFLVEGANDSISGELKEYIGKKKYSYDELTGSLFLKTYPHHPQTINNIVHNLVTLTNFNCLGVYIPSGTPAGRIASGLAHAVELVQLLATSGISPQVSLQRVSFAVETGSDFFIDVASLKVLRFLWFQVVRAYGISDFEPRDLYIQSISTAWVNPAFEPHSNMLKATTAAMAAVIGGCNALTVLPESESDTRMIRITRNVSTLLKEESRFDKVADPLAGSFYLESLTNQLIDKAWGLFQQKMSGT
jgi:methylmalonyl-CoA mutase